MISTNIPDARARRATKTQLREEIANAARCLRFAKGAVDRGDFESAAMWAHFAEQDVSRVETLARGA
jgi:hypothetical protein